MTGAGRGLLECVDLFTGRGHRGLCLGQLQARVEAGGIAVTGEREHLFTLLEGVARDLQLQSIFLQACIHMRDVRRQRQARGLCVDLGGTLGADRTFISGAILTPEIQLPGQGAGQQGQRVPVACIRRRKQTVLRETPAHGLAAQARTGAAGAVSRRDLCERRACARLGDAQTGIARERIVDQLIELGVPISHPPLRLRPCGGVKHSAVQGFLRLQAVGLHQGGFGSQPMRARASGEQQYDSCEK